MPKSVLHKVLVLQSGNLSLPSLGLTSLRATASYLYEGLVAANVEPCAADCDGVAAISNSPLLFTSSW